MFKLPPHLGALLLVSPAVMAADLSGRVEDTSGRPIPGATVEVVGTNLKATTNTQGKFVLEGVNASKVELHTKAPFHTHTHADAQLDSSEPLVVRLAPSAMEIIDVVALPWHASTLESATPVEVLAGEKLRNKQASTLGETLKNEIGVHSSYHGPVASSPIIRGLGGPRVLITQNSLDAGDASRVGPDHAVATEASTAQQIEILRGPATLLYGSGASGGVINIVDNRVPKDNLTKGAWQLQHNTVADENLASASFTGGANALAFHVDGFWRESNDYKIPVAAEIDHQGETHEHRLENSAYDAQGLNLGGSYLLDNGFVGLSYGRLERSYGIPGHEHGDEHEEHEEHGEHGHEEELHADEEEGVYADLEQDRIQLHSEISLNHGLFSALNSRIGYTDYVHHEIEAGEIVTTFANESSEARFELYHHPLNDWRGVLSFQYKHQDFSAIGLEAFTPPSTTESFALALMEERHFGEVQLQLGARVERVEINADRILVALDEDYDPADHEHTDTLSVLSVKNVFEPFSLSAGLVWDFTEGYNLGVSLSHSQRAPSAAELFSYGPHLGSGNFEVGAIFDLHPESDGSFHVDLNLAPLELETSNNLDISLRKFAGDLGFTLNAFYNRIDDFYYLREAGFAADDGHGDEEGLPLYVFTAADAHLYGFEAQVVWQASESIKLTNFADYTRASLRAGSDLPRIPPLRLGTEVSYSLKQFTAELSAVHYFEQDQTAPMETGSDAYTLVDAQLSYDWIALGQDLTVYLKASNLTDEEARPHTSFLKNRAPLPARAFAAGIRSRF